MDLLDFDYDLDETLIAQTPIEKRDASRLMVLDKKLEKLNINILWYYRLSRKGDTLVLNNTKVLPARLIGTKEETNAVIEVLLLKI